MDDLDQNSLWCHLQKNCQSLINAVEAKNGLILLPPVEHTSSAAQLQMMAECHTVVPSPYFRGVFSSARPNCNYSVHVDGGRVCTEQGFPVKVKAVIVDEELCYGTSGSYRILAIDTPLLMLEPHQKENDERSSLIHDYTPRGSAAASEVATSVAALQNQTLDSAAESEQFIFSRLGRDSITMINQELDEFTGSYLIVPKFLDDCSRKLKDLHARIVQKLGAAAELARAVENLILSRMYDKLFAAVCKHCELKISRMRAALRHTWNAGDFSLPARYEERLAPCQSRLSALTSAQTSFAKARLIKQALNDLQQCVGSLQVHGDATALTSDDCIPLMALALSRIESSSLPAHLSFLELFSCCRSAADETSYAVATLQAALAYLLELSAEKEKLSAEKEKRTAAAKPQHQPTPAALQREIYSSPLYKAHAASKQQEDLGDFLSNLDGMMDGTFGKLS